MKYKYKIPLKLINEFVQISGKNYSTIQSDQHVETLALLLGHGEAEITATNLVFPDQIGSSNQVEDKSKCFI